VGLRYTAVNPPTHPVVQSITERKSRGVDNGTVQLLYFCVYLNLDLQLLR